MNTIIDRIRITLQAQGDSKTRQSTHRFFKEKIELYGLKSANTKKICQVFYREIKDESKTSIFKLCEQLWQSGMFEECIIAAWWTEKLSKQFLPNDIELFEQWINKYVTNWATCDTFCTKSVGNIIIMYPQLMPYLKIWAKSENLWLRRAAAVSLIIPASKGYFLNDAFEIADIMLADKEDLVQKGYGWLLKVAANNHEKEVFEYVVSKKSIMPRTALRYAIEKMPRELRKIAMSK